ncbi:IS110 family transposase [Dehalococcoidia bacterium]|nr:IS110 family transposase [Dehalococcoidia bacterium]
MKKQSDHILRNEKVFVGLEDSKKTWRVCVRSGRMIVHETSMPAQYEVLRNYLHNKFPECQIQVIYEAGFRGFELHDRLEADGWECVVTPPHTVTEEKCQRKKNDRRDCRRLAKNLENGDYHSCFVPDKELREDRQTSRTYGQVQKDITRVCNRIRRTLEFHGLDNDLPSGRWSGAMYVRVRAHLGEMEMRDSVRFSFEVMFRELEHLRQLQKELLQRLRRLGRSDRYKESVRLLMSAPGIGMLTAIRLALEWGNVSRFRRKEEFVSFLGLVPSEYSSGEQERRGHITKQGNRGSRAWLVECSWVAIKHDPVLLDKWRRVFRNCGSKKKAIVAVARKLASRLRRVLLTGEPYVVGVLE